jgi:hypothetical protein
LLSGPRRSIYSSKPDVSPDKEMERSMKNLTLATFTALSLTAAIAPVARVHAEPAPSTLEQAVHANVRIMHGGAIPGDNVPFPAFEHTDISAADILNSIRAWLPCPSGI